MKTISLMAVILGTLCLAPALARQAPTVTYEMFCSKDRMGKQELFKTMTAEQKTMLWRTQIERWRDLNRARLTADQRALLDEFHAIIPLAVARPRTLEGDAKLEALEARLTAAFTEDEMDAMDNYGPCLAKAR